MLVPLHIATLVLVALLLVTLAAWRLVGPTAHGFRFVLTDDREPVPVPAGQRHPRDLTEQWRLCNARRGSPAARLNAQLGRCIRMWL